MPLRAHERLCEASATPLRDSEGLLLSYVGARSCCPAPQEQGYTQIIFDQFHKQMYKEICVFGDLEACQNSKFLKGFSLCEHTLWSKWIVPKGNGLNVRLPTPLSSPL